NATGQAQHLLLLGGTSEIGLGIISEFLERGPAKVSLAARADSPRITDAVESLKAQGADVEVIDFDATDFEAHPGVIDKAFQRGDVDVAVVAFGTLATRKNCGRTKKRPWLPHRSTTPHQYPLVSCWTRNS